VTRWARYFLFSTIIGALALAGCKKAGENKEAVKEGVLTHLSKNAALDVNQLAIDVTDVKFNGNEATATVSIKPKSAPEQAMSMSYTLERQGEKWLVKGKAAGHAGGGGGMGAPMEGGAPSSSPAPVMPPSGMGGGESGPGGAKDLPSGHPPVNAPPASK